MTPDPDSSPGRPDPGPQPTRSPPRRAGIFLLAFGSGFAVMVVEIAGARLMAPAFGLSAVPWTAVIGVILAALATGNWVGGRMADAGVVPLSWPLTAAGLTALVPVVGAGVPPLALELMGFVGGAVAAAVVLFAPPVLALGTAVPYLVRADTPSLERVGRGAGEVSAAATAGSIAGTFATGFVLLPLVPLPILMGLTAAGLFGLAALSAVVTGRGGVGGLALLGAAGAVALGATAGGEGPGVLAREQTLYSSIRVTEGTWSDGRTVRQLWQNGGSSTAEYVDTGEPAHAYARASLELLEPLLPAMDSALVLGGGALSLPLALRERQPALSVTVVELDPAVTRLAREHFAYGRREPGDLRVVHGDARRYLAGTGGRWDLLYLDVFDHLLTVPWTMVTREALEAMGDHLTPDGVLVVNVLSPLGGPGAAFLERFLATLEAVFPVVRQYPLDPGPPLDAVRNVLVAAGRSPEALPDPAGWEPSPVAPRGPVLTDAHAPVEALQARVLWRGIRWR